MKTSFNSLSHRYAFYFATILTTLALFILLLIGYLIYQHTEVLRSNLTAVFSSHHLNDRIGTLTSSGIYLSNRLFNPLFTVDIGTLNEEIGQISEWLNPKKIEILDHKGRLVTDGTELNPHYGDKIRIPDNLSAGQPVIRDVENGQELFFVIGYADRIAGYAHIIFSNEKDRKLIELLHSKVSEQWRSYFTLLILAGIVGLILILIFSGIIINKLAASLSRPLQQMIEAAENFAEGRLDYKVPDVSNENDEVGRLALSLKKMSESLFSANKKIIKQAHYDVLTGLPNRFLVMDRLNYLIKSTERGNHRIGVLFLDMDDFKKVNDTFGHDAGDALLKLAAQRLLNIVRDTDTVSRLGGDEFLLLLTDLTEATDTIPIVKSILAQFRKPFTIKNQEFLITVSIGVAIYPEDGNGKTQLLKNADSAMYHAKELGRNTYTFFTESLNQKVARRLELETRLHNALGNRELFLEYQPKVDLKNGTLIGVEALLRWNNPHLGFVSPAEFIPVAENTGLIIPIGKFVISESMKQLKNWLELTDDNFHVAINLSPRQFRDKELIPYIKHLLLALQIKGKHIELEITEGVLLSGDEQVSVILEAFHQLGFNLSMDDFGKGYSSLSYLKNYPFNIIKIDRSFVRDLDSDEDARKLVNAVVGMAHILGIEVTAEGIETDAQLSYLKSFNCNYGQGFYYSQSVKATKITALLNPQPIPLR